MDSKDGKGIIPISRLANSVGSSLFEGNDRDLTWDREVSGEGKTAYISFWMPLKLAASRMMP